MLKFFDLLKKTLLNSSALFHDWRTAVCGSLYRTCCLSLSPFLSTPKKLLLQKDLCLPLGERRTQWPRRLQPARRRPPASKAPRRVEPGAARGWAPRYGTSSWWKPHYLESRSLRLLSPLHRTTRPCHRARRACATPHATTPHQRRPRPPPSSTRQRGMVEPLPSYSSLENAH